MLSRNNRKGQNMGKSSKPAYTNGVVTINGEEKASQYKQGNTVYSNYNMSDAEKKLYNYAQSSFLENLPKINVFSEETQKNMQDQLNAYTQKGIQTINDIYTPMLDDLKTDIASRFGNFDNSIFMDDLKEIESSRSDAMNSLAQDILTKQDDIINEELNRRYNYLDLLGSVQNQTLGNVLSYLQQAASNSNSGNSYNNNQSSSSTSAFSDYANLAASIASSLFTKRF